MPTLIIETTPESLAEAVASLLPSDRARFDAALQNFATAANVPDEEDNEPTSPEDLAAIGRAIADYEAGRVHDGKSVFEQIRKERGLPPR